jgi:hypothetical protein
MAKKQTVDIKSNDKFIRKGIHKKVAYLCPLIKKWLEKERRHDGKNWHFFLARADEAKYLEANDGYIYVSKDMVKKWAEDIEEQKGMRITTPLIGGMHVDGDKLVSRTGQNILMMCPRSVYKSKLKEVREKSRLMARKTNKLSDREISAKRDPFNGAEEVKIKDEVTEKIKVTQPKKNKGNKED